jgi:hypothetical protein
VSERKQNNFSQDEYGGAAHHHDIYESKAGKTGRDKKTLVSRMRGPLGGCECSHFYAVWFFLGGGVLLVYCIAMVLSKGQHYKCAWIPNSEFPPYLITVNRTLQR